MIIGGIGAAAIGAAIGSGILIKYGTATAVGSILGQKITEHVQDGYNQLRVKSALGKKVAKETISRN